MLLIRKKKYIDEVTIQRDNSSRKNEQSKYSKKLSRISCNGNPEGLKHSLFEKVLKKIADLESPEF